MRNRNRENQDIPICPYCDEPDNAYVSVDIKEDADGECVNCGKTYECIWETRYTTKKI